MGSFDNNEVYFDQGNPSTTYLGTDVAYPLLTPSQEMHLLGDHDVGVLVNHLLVEQEQEDWKNKDFAYEQGLLVQQVLDANDIEQSQKLMHQGMPVLVSPSSTSIYPPAPSLISNEDYTGPFKFEMFIVPQSGNKNPWVYSGTLHKLFIAITSPFPIDFKCTWPSKNMFIRATPIFSLAQHSQDLVTRCIAHASAVDPSNKNVSDFIWNHVIRCQNPNSVYQGCVDKSVRLSVVVPLEKPQTGTDTVRHLFMFMCKNSCPSGMNRRPFEVVFTLEDALGQVFGRHKLNVRVCSCPKRDKDKEEKIYLKENGSGLLSSSGKRRKVADNKKLPVPGDYPVDVKEYSLPWNVCGKHNQLLVLNYCYNLMAGELMQHGPNDNIQKCLDNLAETSKNMK